MHGDRVDVCVRMHGILIWIWTPLRVSTGLLSDNYVEDAALHSYASMLSEYFASCGEKHAVGAPYATQFLRFGVAFDANNAALMHEQVPRARRRPPRSYLTGSCALSRPPPQVLLARARARSLGL